MLRWCSGAIQLFLCYISLFYAETLSTAIKGSKKIMSDYWICIKYISVSIKSNEKNIHPSKNKINVFKLLHKKAKYSGDLVSSEKSMNIFIISCLYVILQEYGRAKYNEQYPKC